MRISETRAPYEELYAGVFYGRSVEEVNDTEMLSCIPEDAVQTVSWVLQNHPNLTDREKELMQLKYVEGLNLLECGKKFNVTRERVRQIIAKGLRKMRHGKYNLYRMVLSNGIGMYEEVKSDYEMSREQEKEELLREIEKADIELQKLRQEASLVNNSVDVIKSKLIDECDLSVRSINCLRRAGVVTVGQLMELSRADLAKIRNLGVKCIDEICMFFISNGLNAACLKGDHSWLI